MNEVIELVVDGKLRRLRKLEKVVPVVEVKKRKKLVYTVSRTWTKRNERKARKKVQRGGFKVELFLWGELVGEFDRLELAAQKIGVSKSEATKIFYGKRNSAHRICQKIKS